MLLYNAYGINIVDNKPHVEISYGGDDYESYQYICRIDVKNRWLRKGELTFNFNPTITCNKWNLSFGKFHYSLYKRWLHIEVRNFWNELYTNILARIEYYRDEDPEQKIEAFIEDAIIQFYVFAQKHGSKEAMESLANIPF